MCLSLSYLSSAYDEGAGDIDIDNSQLIDFRNQTDYLANYQPADSKFQIFKLFFSLSVWMKIKSKINYASGFFQTPQFVQTSIYPKRTSWVWT